MSWTPLFTVIGSILAAFVGATLVAHFGFKQWREQRWIERREHLAEQVLADFYEVQGAFSWVRSPGTFSGEGETRSRPQSEEPPELERLRNAYFILFPVPGSDRFDGGPAERQGTQGVFRKIA